MSLRRPVATLLVVVLALATSLVAGARDAQARGGDELHAAASTGRTPGDRVRATGGGRAAAAAHPRPLDLDPRTPIETLVVDRAWTAVRSIAPLASRALAVVPPAAARGPPRH